MLYKSILQMKRKNKALGKFWFSRGAKDFFNSEIESKIFHGQYFITSERFDLSEPKRYTIRRCDVCGSISTVRGGFREYATLAEAIEIIKEA